MTPDPNEIYNRLLKAEPASVECATTTIQHIGDLIDISTDLSATAGARRAIQLCDGLRQNSSLTDEESALLYYFEANAWSVLVPWPGVGATDAWSWKNESFDNMIRRLRQAQRSPGFVHLDPLRRSQILTNLGNALDTIGRFVEALECYDRAVRVCPAHGMARGNLGVCLMHFGAMQPHLPHRPGYCTTTAFLIRAREELEAALITLVPGDSRTFALYRDKIEHMLAVADGAEALVPRGAVPGTTKDERAYRRWCLLNCLFLNPINDLGRFAEASTDPLHLPPIVAELTQKKPYVQSLFNQLKQEYVTARFLLYEGIATKQPHFSDREVTLVNTLDYSAYSLYLEKTRLAFRMAYSQFDKIAFLLNAYLDLRIHPQRVNFRTLWYQNEEPKREIKLEFQKRENWPLRGLFGLSRDLSARNDDRDALDPDAQDLVLIRNHLEHKHIIIHEESWIGTGRGRGGETADGLSFAIDRQDFESRAVRSLKLARSALLYLIHALVVEEQERAKSRAQTDVILPLVLDPIDDDWKR
jgi:tetratricopeptide (TPR) repeat protein